MSKTGVQVVFRGAVLLLGCFGHFFLFPMLELLVRGPAVVLVRAFVICVGGFHGLIILCLSLGGFPGRPDGSEPVAATSVVLDYHCYNRFNHEYNHSQSFWIILEHCLSRLRSFSIIFTIIHDHSL